MIIAKVTAITPTGEQPWQSEYGPIYTFNVTFDNGVSGKANSKNQSAPPYKVGDMVGYEITGNHQGVNKLKVDKKAAQGAVQPQAQIQPPPQSQPVKTIPDPAAIGMSLKLAGDILMHNARTAAEPIDLASLTGNLWEVAGSILEAGDGLRLGIKPKPDGDIPF